MINGLTIIGDPHGKLDQYKKIISNSENTLSVGDLGFKNEWDEITRFVSEIDGFHKNNPGNHEYGPYVDNHKLSTGNFQFFDALNLFTVRGAESIDKHLRTEGIDWFANEELNYQEQLAAFDEYCRVKPKVVISHDCPQTVMTSLFGYTGKSQTRTMLEMMFQEHQPQLWVFGHHHKSKDVQINGTRFVCLNELETLTIEI